MRHFEIGELEAWLEVRFDRASGPGGQHVNKVSTRAHLLFDFRACPLLTEPQRARIAALYTGRLTHDGRLQVVAQKARSQSENRLHAEHRLIELLAAALHVPKSRRPTRPTRSSQRYRVAAKKQRGEIKRQRRMRPSAGD